MDWALAAAAIILGKLIAYKLLALVNLPLPFAPVLTGMICPVLFFPIMARLAAWTERQWLATACPRRPRGKRATNCHSPPGRRVWARGRGSTASAGRHAPA